MYIGLILPILVSLVGGYLLIKLRFFFLAHPIRTAREFCCGLSDRGSRRAFCLALAGTLGVGNIFGVAAGIMIGGAGSLFWLFVSSFFAMIIKYAETLLAFDADIKDGGTAQVIKKSFKKGGKSLSVFYAFLTLMLAFFMGSAMQSAALTDVSDKSLGIKPIASLFVLIILLIPAFIGGGKKIEKITEFVIPMTTTIYILMCFAVIILNFDRLPYAVNVVIDSAFSLKSWVGGISIVAIREGFSRGILSNEAGVGTSAMAHIRSKDRSAHTAGLFAMSEVVFDSLILCMLTGIVILLVVPDPSHFSSPMALVSAAFKSCLGGFSELILPLLILSFAYATIICWYYYGEECIRLYFHKIRGTYPLFFVISILFSAFLPYSIVIFLVDVILLLMSFIVLSAIVIRSPRIAELCTIKSKNPE